MISMVRQNVESPSRQVRAAASRLLAAVLLGLTLSAISCGPDEAELQALAHAESADTIYAYRDFLGAYPEAHDLDRVQARLAELEVLRDWQHATRVDTAAAWASFLSAHPMSDYAEQAKQRREWLLVDEARDPSGYRAYIEEHQDQKLAHLAERRLAQLEYWDDAGEQRAEFQALLVDDVEVSKEFHPEAVEFAIDLLEHDLHFEAMAVLAVVHYHADVGSEACIRESISILDGPSGSRHLDASRRLLNKGKVMSKLDYLPLIERIRDVLVEPGIEVIGERSLLQLMLAEAEESSGSEQWASKVWAQVATTYRRPVFPAFVERAIEFVGQGDQLQHYSLTRMPVPDALPYALGRSRGHALPGLFSLYDVVTSLYPDEVMAALEAQSEDASRLNLVYGLGLAGEHSALDHVLSLSEGSDDPFLRIACWYYLTQIGDDHSTELNTLLGMALDPARRTPESIAAIRLTLAPDHEDWTELGSDVLVAFQWMSLGNESRIDRSLLNEAMYSDDQRTASFALAITKDLHIDLQGEALVRVMDLVENGEDRLGELAVEIVEANLVAILGLPFDYPREGTAKQRGAILAALDPEQVPELDERLEAAIASAVKDWEPELRRGAIHAIAEYELTEYRDMLVEWIQRDSYGLQAGVTLLRLGENSAAIIARIEDLDGDNANLLRCLLEDETTRSELLHAVKQSHIRDRLDHIAMASRTRQPYFYDALRSQTRYRNRAYAPTDYFVAHAAQAASITMLLDVPDLKR
jgi:hypothetical protein